MEKSGWVLQQITIINLQSHMLSVESNLKSGEFSFFKDIIKMLSQNKIIISFSPAGLVKKACFIYLLKRRFLTETSLMILSFLEKTEMFIMASMMQKSKMIFQLPLIHQFFDRFSELEKFRGFIISWYQKEANQSWNGIRNGMKALLIFVI